MTLLLKTETVLLMMCPYIYNEPTRVYMAYKFLLWLRCVVFERSVRSCFLYAKLQLDSLYNYYFLR